MLSALAQFKLSRVSNLHHYWQLSYLLMLKLTVLLDDSTDADVEEMAIGVHWVTDGIDRCLVGFLPCHCVRHKQKYEGRVAQVVEFLKLSESPSV